MSKPHEKTYEKEKVSFNLAKLKLFGENIEIVVDPDVAIEYKSALKKRKEKDIVEVGEPDIRDVLKSEEIFHDAHKGELASEHFLENTFGTFEPIDVAKRILLDGEIQLTAEYRKKMLDAKKRKIIEIIHRHAIDPTNGMPHPISRIERLLDNIHFRIDKYKTAEDQVEDAVHMLKPVIPIKFDTKQIQIVIYGETAKKVYGILKQYKILKESWNTDGSLTLVFETPAGLRVEFIEKINEITHGGADIKVLED